MSASQRPKGRTSEIPRHSSSYYETVGVHFAHFDVAYQRRLSGSGEIVAGLTRATVAYFHGESPHFAVTLQKAAFTGGANGRPTRRP